MGDRSPRTIFPARRIRRALERAESSLVWSSTSRQTGHAIEITAPANVSLAALNAVLKELGHAPASEADLAPLHAA
jgi:hypothetical protein